MNEPEKRGWPPVPQDLLSEDAVISLFLEAHQYYSPADFIAMLEDDYCVHAINPKIVQAAEILESGQLNGEVETVNNKAFCQGAYVALWVAQRQGGARLLEAILSGMETMQSAPDNISVAAREVAEKGGGAYERAYMYHDLLDEWLTRYYVDKRSWPHFRTGFGLILHYACQSLRQMSAAQPEEEGGSAFVAVSMPADDNPTQEIDMSALWQSSEQSAADRAYARCTPEMQQEASKIVRNVIKNLDWYDITRVTQADNLLWNLAYDNNNRALKLVAAQAHHIACMIEGLEVAGAMQVAECYQKSLPRQTDWTELAPQMQANVYADDIRAPKLEACLRSAFPNPGERELGRTIACVVLEQTAYWRDMNLFATEIHGADTEKWDTLARMLLGQPPAAEQ